MVGHAALQCNETDELRTRIVNMLPVVFRANQCGFILANGKRESLDLHHAVEFGNPNHDFWTSRYIRRFRKKDPISQRLQSLKPLVSTLDQLLSFEDLLQTDYYNEFLRPQAIYYMMFIELRSQGRLIGHIGLHRSKHKGNFSQEEIAKAEQLTPYLTAALQNSLHLEKIAEKEFITDCVSEMLPFEGVLILNEAFRPVYKTRCTERLLRDFGHCQWGNGDSAPSISEAIYRYCQHLEKVTGPKWDSKQNLKELLVTNSDGEKLKIDILRKNPGSGRVRYLVFLKLESPALPRSKKPFHGSLKHYGLTRREAEVADLMYRGFTRSGITEKLCISKYTVNSHIASFYKKLGVSNQIQCLHFLMEMDRNAS